MSDVTISSARSPDLAVIEGINFQIRSGEFWVIGGPHASGKTDFLMTAAALQKPLRGDVRIFGEDTMEMTEATLIRVREKIGLVFENGGRLFNRLTIAENVALPLRYHKNLTANEANDSVKKILEDLDLLEFADELPVKLSTSWRQRAALARALILKPTVLLLDKPLIGLRHRQWWSQFLQKLSEGNFITETPMTIIVATDDLNFWKNQATHFALLKNNRWQPVGGRTELEKLEPPLLTDDLITD